MRVVEGVHRGWFDMLANIVGLFHAEEQKDQSHTGEDTGPVKYPTPTLVFGNEPTDDGGEVVAAREEKAIESHISSSLMSKVLALSGIGFPFFLDGVHTTSVTVISGRASTGAVKKPERMFRAIHWPLEGA